MLPLKAGYPYAGCPGRYINVLHCVRPSVVILQLIDTLELFVKRREFLPGSGFLSCGKVTFVESDVKTHSFIPLSLKSKGPPDTSIM